MAILSRTSTDLMLSLKIVLISTSVLGAAVMLTISFPAITEFAVYDVPSIYNVVVSWLRPPYLYLVINCIIIAIVATSKLQSKKHDLSPATAPAPFDTMVHLQPQPVMPIVKNVQTDYESVAEYKYSGVLSNNYGYEVEMGKGLGFDACVQENARIIGNETPFTANVAAPAAAIFKDDSMSNKENEFVISKSTRMLSVNEDSTEYYTPKGKLPASVRFGHRRNVKSSPDGGKSLLGVSKAKRHDTLESTWKTITDGRAVPLTRHLRKSDTWERDNHHHHSSHHQQQQLEKTPQKMTKAETFKDRTNAASPLSTPSPGCGGLGKLRKEPSLGQDELNKRVEAFIKKFNEEMRLQRQESLNIHGNDQSRLSLTNCMRYHLRICR